MAEHGGYRTPSQPAAVSGPGAHSARTDRGVKQYQVTGGSYGSSQDFAQQESAAPLSPPSGAPGSTAPVGIDTSGLTGLAAPTSQPETPVTDGAAAGAGVGPDAMFGQQVRPDSEEAKALGAKLQVMVQIADSDGATPAFKKYVRQIIANL